MGKHSKNKSAGNDSDRYQPSSLMEDLGGEPAGSGKLDRKLYEKELARLQVCDARGHLQAAFAAAPAAACCLLHSTVGPC